MDPIEEEKYDSFEENKEFDIKSESPHKGSEVSIISLYKDFYNKPKILGEKTSLLPSIIAPVYLGIRKVVIQERMAVDKLKVSIN